MERQAVEKAVPALHFWRNAIWCLRLFSYALWVKNLRDSVENLVHFYDLFSDNTDFSQMSDHQLQKTEFSTTANAGNTPLPFRILKSNQFAGIKIMFFQFIRKIITYTSLATIVQHKFFGKLCYCCTSFFLVGENRRQCRWFQKVLGMSGKNVLLW